MKILTVKFAEDAQPDRVYNYRYFGDVDVEIGDVAIANMKQVNIVNVQSEDSAAAKLATKEIVFVFSTKQQRQEAQRVARVAELKATLLAMKERQNERALYEEIAAAGGSDAMQILAELKALDQ